MRWFLIWDTARSPCWTMAIARTTTDCKSLPTAASGARRACALYMKLESFLLQDVMVHGQLENAIRNVLIGPGVGQCDISLLKNLQVREKAKLQFRAESFNTINHPSFTGINTTV